MPASVPVRPVVLWDRLRAVVRLLRPLNMVMFMLGVALGGLLTAGPLAFQSGYVERLLLAALSAALIGAGANSINDVFDLRIDRLNRPERPLPSGQVRPRTARRIWLGGSLAGVGLSFWLTPAHVVLAGMAVGLLYIYSRHLKRTVLWGNLVVALLVALLLIYGGWAAGDPGAALVGATFAFLTTLARELVKDLEDVEGDRAEGARTLPVVYGPQAAVRAASFVLVVTIMLTPLPYGLLHYGGLFLFLVFMADLLLLRALWLLQAPQPRRQAAHASRILKVAMVVGMGALALAWVA